MPIPAQVDWEALQKLAASHGLTPLCFSALREEDRVREEILQKMQVVYNHAIYMDIQFSYRSGFHGTFISATGEAPGINRLEIWGSKGRLTMEGNKITFAKNELSTEEFGCVNTEKFAKIPFTVHEEVFDRQVNPYGIVFENFAAHLLSGEPLLTTGRDGLREVQLANAIYVSGWEEKKVTVPVAEERFLDGLVLRQEMERNR